MSNLHARWRIFGPCNSFCHTFHSLIPLVFHPEEVLLSLHNRMEIAQKSALLSSTYSTLNLKVIWNSFFNAPFWRHGQLNLITYLDMGNRDTFWISLDLMNAMFSRTDFFFFWKAVRRAIIQKYLAVSGAYLGTEVGFIIFKYFS